ncbi:hypothetical protein ACIBCU_13000 [Streptomyces sp. NPDC051064]|uniref:hypothetical protein n=1 Tax=Streptomyces sp. NPDC051064 TaxID=3365641 RepID=UPI0037A6F37E
MLDRSPVVLPIPGTARIDHLEENAAAGSVRLTPAHLEILDRLAPPEQGPRPGPVSEEDAAPQQHVGVRPGLPCPHH